MSTRQAQNELEIGDEIYRLHRRSQKVVPTMYGGDMRRLESSTRNQMRRALGEATLAANNISVESIGAGVPIEINRQPDVYWVEEEQGVNIFNRIASLLDWAAERSR